MSVLGFAKQSRSLRHIQKFAGFGKAGAPSRLGHHNSMQEGAARPRPGGGGAGPPHAGFNKDKLASHGARGIAVCVSVMDVCPCSLAKPAPRGSPALAISYDRTNKNFWMCRRESGSKSCYDIKMSLIFTCSYSQFPSVLVSEKAVNRSDC